MLEVTNLETGYGGAKVLHGLSLSVGKGARVGLFGPNGHGKTTFLRTVSGLVRPWVGDVRLNSQSIVSFPPRKIVAQGLVHVPQGSSLFPDLTVSENLRLGAYLPANRRSAKRSLDFVETIFPRLAERRNQLCKTLSGGERQMVAVGMGLMSNPKLLMLDEPTLGLAPKLKQEFSETICQIADSGVTLIIVEQDVEFLFAVTDRQVMIDRGVNTVELDAEHGIDHEEIMEMYFGRKAVHHD